MRHITIGVVLSHGFPVPSPFVVSYSLLQQYLLQGVPNATLPPHLRIDGANVLWGQDFPIDHARNRVCKLFLEHTKATHLLFLDSDMTHPPDLPHRLMAHDVDVVTGRYVMRKPPFFSVAMRKTGDGPEDYQALEKLLPLEEITGLLPIDAAGAGALLISREALLAIRERIGEDWFRYQDGPAGLRSRSEDMWFFEQAKAAGFQPYLDADLHCGHVARFEVDTRWHLPYHEAHAQVSA